MFRMSRWINRLKSRLMNLQPNKSFQLTGPFVTRLAVWGSRQAARQPFRQLNSTVSWR